MVMVNSGNNPCRLAVVGALLAALLGCWTAVALADAAENAPLFVAAPGVDLDTITYPTDRWDPNVLASIAGGPALFAPGHFDTAIPPPPKNSSAETRANLDALLVMQEKERTPEQLRLINDELQNPLAEFERTGLYRPMNGRPVTRALLGLAEREMMYFVPALKQKFNRARPTQLEPKLHAVIPVPRHAAYPSGHGTQVYLIAYLLGKLDPAHQKDYDQAAYGVAHRREIAGVQYPSDGVAAKKLGIAMVDAVLALPQAQELFVKAQQEWPQQK